MEFRNITPFPALAFESLDQRDTRFHTVVMRLSFELQADGTLAFAPVQTPLATSDEYFGETGVSSVRQESDLAPYKPHTDVIVNATGHAPQGRPERRFVVGVKLIGDPRPGKLPLRPQGLNQFCEPSSAQLGQWRVDLEKAARRSADSAVIFDKQMVATGPREWRKVPALAKAMSAFLAPRWLLEWPAPILELPLRYEYAYGGGNQILWGDPEARRVKPGDRLPLPEADEATRSMAPIAHTVYPMNPVGRGFAEKWYLKAAKPKRLSAPQIEAVGELLKRFAKAVAPQGFGVIGRAWTPRLALAGTYDADWLAHRHPHLPADFDFAYWNAAPLDQQVAPHLAGDETIVLSNLFPPGTPGARQLTPFLAELPIKLPGHVPYVLARFQNGMLGELAARLDTVIVEVVPGKPTSVVCVWRATIAASPPVRVLEARMLGRALIYMLRECGNGNSSAD